MKCHSRQCTQPLCFVIKGPLPRASEIQTEAKALSPAQLIWKTPILLHRTETFWFQRMLSRLLHSLLMLAVVFRNSSTIRGTLLYQEQKDLQLGLYTFFRIFLFRFWPQLYNSLGQFPISNIPPHWFTSIQRPTPSKNGHLLKSGTKAYVSCVCIIVMPALI